VPTGKWLWIQLQYAGRASAVTHLIVSPSQGAVVRDISLSPSSAPTLAALDSLENIPRTTSSDASGGGLQLSGTASLAGTVRAANGQPLEGAQITVRDARSSAVSDNTGRFVLGNLPAGTQVMLTRHLGYELVESTVELRPAKSVIRNVQLTRAILLDTVKTIAAKPQLAEFEVNRRTNAMGRFITRADIVRRNPKETADLITGFSGFRVLGYGLRAKVVSRAVPIGKLCTEANVVVDEVEGLGINDVPPENIAGIEIYQDGTFAPAKYANRADCGLVVIWMRPSTPNAASSAAALKYNGYP
jgi:hypothetical protein